MERIKGAKALENERHEAFCHELLANQKFSIAEAGNKTGFKNRQNAWEVYQREDVQDRLKFLQEMRIADLRVDQYMVINNLKTIAEKAMEEGEYPAANKANELLGKHLGMFSDKVEHKHSGNVNLGIKVVFEDDGETSTK